MTKGRGIRTLELRRAADAGRSCLLLDRGRYTHPALSVIVFPTVSGLRHGRNDSQLM